MTKGRIEAFSDGVIAIIITIMVLEMKVPHGDRSVRARAAHPVFMSYVLSFVYVGIYWNNHHHMLHTMRHVNGRVLWANLHLLFWLSLIPFATGWMGENHFAAVAGRRLRTRDAVAGIAYFILTLTLIRCHGRVCAGGRGRNEWKGSSHSSRTHSLSRLSFVHPMIAVALYVTVAMVWFIPDRRIERTIGAGG